MTKNRTALEAELSSAADQALAAANRAIDDSRQIAGEAAARIGDTMRDLRASATDVARKGADSVSDATAAAQRQLNGYAQATTRYVAREPVKSALIAAAVGAAVAALVLLLSRNGQDRN